MWASFLIAAVAALVLATNVQSAAFINFHRLEPRYVQGLKAPTGYNYSWAVDNNRLALDTTGLKSYLTRTTINRTATTTQQAFVDSCTQFCEKTNGCAMAHLIMFANFTEGNVICAVYNAPSPKSSAFYTKGINGGNGTVRASYTFTRDAGRVGSVVSSSSSSSSSTSTSSRITSSSTTSSSTSRSSSSSVSTSKAQQSSTSTSSTLTSASFASSTSTTSGLNAVASTTSSTSSSAASSSSSSSSSSLSSSFSSSASRTSKTSTVTATSSTVSSTTTKTTTSTSSSSSSASTAVPTWQWIDVPGTQCGNGSPTGMAVNLYPGSTELLIRFQEGGACYDYNTCWVQNKAYNMNGFNKGSFYGQNQPIKLPYWYPFNRTADANAWQSSNLVWLPYCTGDFFSGDNVVTYSANGSSKVTYHKGSPNSKLQMAALNAMVPGVTRVWVTGTSAGAFATPLQYQNAQDAFPAARVDLLQDSGETPISILVHPSQNMQVPDKTRCPNCNDSIFDSYLVGLAQANPGSRFGSMSAQYDPYIPRNQGVDYGTFQRELTRFWAQQDSQTSNARSFRRPGSGHGLFFEQPTIQAADGTVLSNWLQDFKNDSPNWSSH